MFERAVEKYLIKRVKDKGGTTRKVTYQGRAGAPDRWCFFPNGFLLIVECKKPDGVLEKDQEYEIKTLKRLGQEVAVVWSKAQVDELFDSFFLAELYY